MRRPDKLKDHILEAYQGAAELNPRLETAEEPYEITTKEGKKRWLSNHMEGEQFVLQCLCKKQHYRYSTLKSILKKHKLLCFFCHANSARWNRAKLRTVSDSEVALLQALVQAGLDGGWACQVLLEFWHGLIDLYHVVTKTAVQLDGLTHTVRMHNRTKIQQLWDDLQCCIQAWTAGVRLVRLHYQHAELPTVVQAALQLPDPTFILVTVEFDSIDITRDGRQQSFVAWLGEELDDAHRVDHVVPGCILFRKL